MTLSKVVRNGQKLFQSVVRIANELERHALDTKDFRKVDRFKVQSNLGSRN